MSEHEHEHEHEHACDCGHEHVHHHDRDHDHDHDRDHDHDGHGHLHHHQGHGHHHHHEHDHDCDCGCDCGHDHHHHHDHDDHGHEHEHFEERTLEKEPTFSYHVLDLDCPNCARSVQNAVRALPCVEDARLVYATATLEVVCKEDESVTECKREVLKTVRSCGEDLELSDEEKEQLGGERPWIVEHREQVLMFISGFCIVAGLVTEHLMKNEDSAIPFYVAAAIAGLVYVLPLSIAALKRHTADMNVLMSIAVMGALAMGFAGDKSVFADAAIVIFLAQIGEWLEGWSMRKTSGSIRELMNLAPSVAHVVSPDGDVTDVETKGVSEGYTIRVLPGERVPLDGKIVEGASSFNEAPVTGESVPQDKGVGDEVFAGTLNANAVVDVLVTADEDDTTLARIVSQVQGAQAEKAPYESFVNRFAASYTPIIVVSALIVGLVIPIGIMLVRGNGIDYQLWHDWMYRACSLLVIACPCALVISTPVSFVSALNCAAHNGILVKGGAYFDIATKVTHVEFDKTGTLTTGNPQVTKIVALNGATEEHVLEVAATLEASSTHPLARAVVVEAENRSLQLAPVSGAEEIAAGGVRGMVNDCSCTVGKLGFALEGGSDDAVHRAIEEFGGMGATGLVVAEGGVAIGVIGVADTLRPDATESIAALRSRPKAPQVEMLTGDNAGAARAMAQKAGVEHVSAGLLPADKLSHIDELQKAGSVVAMVGDGMNDAPALAKADLGITMGAAASDTALEVADVALLSDSIKQLPEFFDLAVRTMNIVRENIAIAIGVKMVVFVLVILGLAGMGAAVFSDTGVALIVVLNGMRLMHKSKFRW